MKENPYSLVFGKQPLQLIRRKEDAVSVADSFKSELNPQQICIITGIRGSGKTVFLTEICHEIQKDDNWIVVELNPQLDMLKSLAAKLSAQRSLADIFKEAKINLSFFGFGLEISGSPAITDIEMAVEKMLLSLKQHGKKVLITVDEAANTKEMRILVSSFQIYIRQDLPIYFVMTGLYDNIQNLQDEDTLTFLYRAPKLQLEPLNIGAIAENYKMNIGVPYDKAVEMARMTKGYSFAFQVLGYYAWEQKDFNRQVVSEFKRHLEDYAYEKIWSEMSETDKKVAYAVAQSNDGKILEVRKILNYDSNQFNPYRKRLIQKGLLNGKTYGYVSFTLPMFDRFVLENYGL